MRHFVLALVLATPAAAQQIETDLELVLLADASGSIDADSARTFADALIGPPRQAGGRNAIGSALLYGMEQIETNNIKGFRRVIDFSGDSMGNSYGPPITQARDEVVANGITINALPILRGGQIGFDLPSAYEQNIIGGPNAFVIPAESGPAFTEAVKRKLILEIAGDVPATQIAAR